MSNEVNRRGLVRIALAATAAVALTCTSFGAMAAPVKSVLFVNPLPQYPSWRLMGDCIAKAAKSAGLEFTETGPTDGTLNTTVMMQQVQQGTANKVDAIITFPATDGFAPLLQQARDAGIKVVTLYGSESSAAGSDANYGADITELGTIMVEGIAKRDGQQNVGLMIQGPTGVAKTFADAFQAAADKSANVKVIAVVNTNDDASKALDQANALLTAHPEINVIASHMGTATQGAISAIRDKGLEGKVVMVANGPAAGGKEGLESGVVYELLMSDVCGTGAQAVDAAVKLGNGEALPKQIKVDIRMFGKQDGIEDYIAKGWN